MIFMGILGWMLHVFFTLFFGCLDRIMLILHGFEELFTQHKLAHKLSLTIKIDDITRGRRDVDLYWWLQAVQGQLG